MQDPMNQAVRDVNKAVSAVRQARDQFESVLKLEKLTRQVLEMQQKRFALGSDTVEDVITARWNLPVAEGHVVRTRANCARTLIQYEEATGTLLERNNLEMSDAVDGVRRGHR